MSLIHAVLAVHAGCAAANLVLALVWSSWVLGIVGAAWALVAALLFAIREDGGPASEVVEATVTPCGEPVVLPAS
ncbi:hypothetical protein AB0I91_23375 [Actinosynnema sp. NPDC049800]